MREIALPSRLLDVNALEAASSSSVILWKEGRRLLTEHERVKSEKVKLRTVEVGEIGE